MTSPYSSSPPKWVVSVSPSMQRIASSSWIPHGTQGESVRPCDRHSLTHSLTHSLAHSLTRSLTLKLNHSLALSLIQLDASCMLR